MHRAITVLLLIGFLFGSAACSPPVDLIQGNARYLLDSEPRTNTIGQIPTGPSILNDRWTSGIIRNDMADPMVDKATRDAKKALETNLELYYNSLGTNQASPDN